ncbi:MAG: TonB-dependent receptor [Acidobacteriota bacterium]
MVRSLRFALLALFCLLLTLALEAQTTFGVIRGRVLDSSGAPVPHATVVVTNTGTNIAKTVATDSSGSYEVGYLLPGAYSVTAEAAGFKKFVAQDVILYAKGTVLVDAPLTVGDITASVTVEAGAPLITTETAVISDVKTQQQYLQAPLNTRSAGWDSFLYTFMALVPGAQPTSSYYAISFAGTRESANNFTVDGITTNSVLFGNIVGPANPSMEAIREVKVDLSGNSSEYGAPGYVTVITKGGENTLHGSALWYYNTGGLNARDFFATTKPFAVTNDFGFTVSGPVIKNKLFYSGTFEGFNWRSARVLNLNMPSLALRKGDFSALRDSAGNPIVIRDPIAGAVFAGGVIPPSRLNATALKIQERFYPLPTYGDPQSIAGNYRDLVKESLRKEQVDLRLDYQLSARNFLFGRLSIMRAPNGALAGEIPTVGYRIQRRQSRQFVLSDTHTFRPNLTNEFRFGLIRGFNPRNGPIKGPEIVKELGLTNLAPNLPDLEAIPSMAVTGFSTISTLNYLRPAEMVYQWQDNVSWMRGRHTIKMGGEIWHNYGADFGLTPTQAFGNISFTGAYSGHAYADFLLGIPRSASRASSGFSRDHRTNTDWAVFIQDDFKASARLTVNLGLRYEVNPPFKEKENRSSNFDPWSGRLIVPTEASKALLNATFVSSKVVPIVTAKEAGWPERLAYTDKNNFAPRIGLAYKLTSDNKTVVRSAYGIFYDGFTASTWTRLAGGPYTGTENAPPNSITGGVPLWQLPAMFPSTLTLAGTASLEGLNPHVRTMYLQQWNLSLEREVWNLGLRASYIGTKSMKLMMAGDVNQIYPSTTPFSTSRRKFPSLSTAGYRDNGGTGFYNGLVLAAERKMRNGLQFQVSHVWAKNVTDKHGESESAVAPQNIYDRGAEWGDYALTRRHRFVVFSIWELPFGPGRGRATQGLAKHLAGGWSVSAFGLLQAGQYFHPTFSGRDPANTGASGGRADRVGNGNLDNPTMSRWFDTSAFVLPPVNVGRFGNSGVNILRGPGTRVLHMGFFKGLSVRENLRLRLEGTFTNILNHTNFAIPDANISGASAGVIRATQTIEGAGPRTTRLGLRLDF